MDVPPAPQELTSQGGDGAGTAGRGLSAALSVRTLLAVALSLACLLLVDVWRTVIQVRSPQTLYFTYGQPSPVLEIAALVNSVLLTGLILALIWFCIARRERSGRAGMYRVPALVGSLIFWKAASSLLIQAFIDAQGGISRTEFIAVGALVYFVLPAALLPAIILKPRKLWKAIEAAAVVLFPFALVCIGQTGWQAIRRAPIPSVARNDPTESGRPTKPLVLWVIFDEMDQSAAFHQALGDLALPNLKALRGASVYAERACQTADQTVKAIPSYLTGRKVTGARWDSESDLMLQFGGSNAPVAWTEQPTLFREAAAEGRRTAMLGYFHPYCRMFGNLAAVCEEFPDSSTGEINKFWATLQSEPLYGAALLQLDHALPGPAVVKRFDGERFRNWDAAVLHHTEREHGEVITRMRRSLLNVLADHSVDFVFFHIPMPHPPGLLNMPDGAPIDDPGYARDLQAADQLLGDIRGALTSSGRWDETALVVTSDHTVRDFWTPSLFLSPSLNSAIAGLKERTIPLLVKLPHQTAPLEYAEPFDAILVHGIVQGLLKEQFGKPEELLDYIRANASKGPCPAHATK